MSNQSADRKLARLHEGTGGEYGAIDDLMEWAAKEIEQLRLDIAQQAINASTIIEQQKEIERLTTELADARDDYARVHKNYMDYRYGGDPPGTPAGRLADDVAGDADYTNRGTITHFDT